ncbi:hypothetical protein B0H13DRAFT_1855938 [Mycena leptocephala]|nr:hypothetical protein B0H13DRAFT_1855938 [Mycena leptocephala]
MIGLGVMGVRPATLVGIRNKIHYSSGNMLGTSVDRLDRLSVRATSTDRSSADRLAIIIRRKVIHRYLWIRHFKWAKTVHGKIGRSAYRAIRHRYYYGQTFRSNSRRKCTDARRHIRNYRSLRLNREPPVPSEFSCVPRLDSTTSTSRGREEQAPSVSPSRDVSNPRDSRFFERRKEEGPVRRGGDRYYAAGADWMDASLLKVDSTRAPRLNLNGAFLPAYDDGHKRVGGDEGNRAKEKFNVCAQLAGLQNDRILLPDRARMRRSAYRTYERDEERAAAQGRAGRQGGEPSASADAGLMEGASAEPDAIRQGHRIVSCVRSSKYAECDSRVDVGRLRLAQGYFGERNVKTEAEREVS